jgi:hypothetical protein
MTRTTAIVLTLALSAASPASAAVCNESGYESTLAGRAKCASEVRALVKKILQHIENVPPEAAKYIEKEMEDARQAPNTFLRLSELRNYKYWHPYKVRKDSESLQFYLETAERAENNTEQINSIIKAVSSMIRFRDEISEYMQKSDKAVRNSDNTLNASAYQLITSVPLIAIYDLLGAIEGAVEEMRPPEGR